MCRFCLNVEGLANCLSVIVSYNVRMYEVELLPIIRHPLVKVNGFASSTYELVTIFSQISFDKVFSSMKHYDNLIELKTLYSKKSGIVHYFRTYIVLEVGFYLYEMRAVGFVERGFTKDAVWLHGVWKLNFIFALL